jgi:hypothetical protein
MNKAFKWAFMLLVAVGTFQLGTYAGIYKESASSRAYRGGYERVYHQVLKTNADAIGALSRRNAELELEVESLKKGVATPLKFKVEEFLFPFPHEEYKAPPTPSPTALKVAYAQSLRR